MIHDMNHSRPVDPKNLEEKLRYECLWFASQINPFDLNIDADALWNIRDCSRISTPTPSPEELTERDETNAKQAYDLW